MSKEEPTLKEIKELWEKHYIKKVLSLMDKFVFDVDNEGQVVLYTGVYEHSDGKYRTEPEYTETEEEMK